LARSASNNKISAPQIDRWLRGGGRIRTSELLGEQEARLAGGGGHGIRGGGG
jgi:hypothetical protein